MNNQNVHTNSRLGGLLRLVIPSLFTVALVFLASPALAQEQQRPSGGGGVLNILLLGCIAYFLVRMFRRRFGGRDDDRHDSHTGENDRDNGTPGKVVRPMDRHEAARQMWGTLSSQPGEAPESAAPESATGFDEADFLEGAKMFFSRFQEARDANDFESIRAFLSDEVYRQAKADMEASTAPARTEIMLLNAKLMEVKSEGGRTYASVFYDAQLRRGVSGEQPVQLRTVWEFSRDDGVDNGLWTLEKINRVDQ